MFEWVRRKALAGDGIRVMLLNFTGMALAPIRTLTLDIMEERS
jgi:hypothetical protein